MPDYFPDITPAVGTAPLPVEPQVTRYAFGDGYTQRVGNGLNPIAENWEVVWTLLSQTDRDTLSDFLKEKSGVTAFLWVPPGEEVARKYTCKRWLFRPNQTLLYDGTATFVEEFDL